MGWRLSDRFFEDDIIRIQLDMYSVYAGVVEHSGSDSDVSFFQRFHHSHRIPFKAPRGSIQFNHNHPVLNLIDLSIDICEILL